MNEADDGVRHNRWILMAQPGRIRAKVIDLARRGVPVRLIPLTGIG